MPPHHRLRGDDPKRLLPLRTDPSEGHLKQLVEAANLWAGVAAFQNHQLLAKSQILKQQITTGTKLATKQTDPGPGSLFLTWLVYRLR
jgi:hypothetical protein